MKNVAELLSDSRSAARVLSSTGEAGRNGALESIRRALHQSSASVLEANSEDLVAARAAGISPALLDRLLLDPGRIEKIIDSLREVLALPDPLSEMREIGERPNGLRVAKRRIPLGVLAVIYEARPNVTVEAASLAIKSG